MHIQPHILFAEDDSDTRELGPNRTPSGGLSVSITGDSAEVLQLLATDNFEALLLDNWMPKVTGIDLCRRIRSFDQSTPIFFCSGAVTEVG
jgi:CheY-like chemotaxis protein